MPPPEIKTIIDKLAKRVALQAEDKAEQFIQLVLQNDPRNAKFNFLKNLQDPYRPYYDQRLFEEKLGPEPVNVEAALVKVMPEKKVENEF